MAIQRFNAVGGYSTGITGTGVIDAIGNITGVSGSFTGTLTGITGNFSGLLSASNGISASALTVSGGVTFSGNAYLGDSATGVTAESNDYVMMMGGTGSAAFKSGFYQTYKVLAGSTTGVICVSPAFNSNTTRGSSTLEITISYTTLVAGPVYTIPIVHKIIIPLIFSYDDLLLPGDYTESIVKGDPAYPLLTFTIGTEGGYSNRLTISTTTPAGVKFTSGWGFRTTVQVH